MTRFSFGGVLKFFILAVVVFCVGVYLNPDELDYIAISIYSSRTTAWVIVFANVIVFVCALLVMNNKKYFYLMMTLFFFSTISIDLIGVKINSDVLDLIFNEYKNAQNAFDAYFKFKYLLWFFAILAFCIFFSKFIFSSKILKESVAFVVFVAMIGFCFAIKIFSPTGANHIIIEPFSSLSDFLYRSMYSLKIVPREQAINLGGGGVIRYKHIVLVVDESINPFHFGINGYSKDTTPYLDSIKNKYTNLSPALSGANCSATSNIMLTSATSADIYPDFLGEETFSKPNLFAYAKNAGFSTAYISAQGGGFLNYMNKHDLASIDLFKSISGESLDISLAYEIIDFIKNNDSTFVYALKYGVHFPWGGYSEPIINESLKIENKEILTKAYDDGITKSVDDFFRVLFGSLGDDVLVIYTSDHGNNVFDDTSMLTTHCSYVGDIPPFQALVPMMIFGDKDIKNIDSKGFYSHFNIVPTLLYNFGYKVDINDTFYSRRPNKYDYFFFGNLFRSADKMYVGESFKGYKK